jgi:CMP-N-acetylneuraminic acid synthetase
MRPSCVILISDCFPREYSREQCDERLGGESLLAIAVRKVLSFSNKEHVFVSSSDKEAVLNLGRKGIRSTFSDPRTFQESVFLPPDIPSLMATVFENLDPDTPVVVLSSSTPFLEIETIQASIARSRAEDFAPLMSVSPVRDHPLHAVELSDQRLRLYYDDPKRGQYVGRQQFPKVYEHDNAIQIFRKTGWTHYDHVVLEGKALGFITRGLDSFQVVSRIDLMLAKKISEIMRSRNIRTNEEFMRLLQSEEYFLSQQTSMAA